MTVNEVSTILFAVIVAEIVFALFVAAVIKRRTLGDTMRISGQALRRFFFPKKGEPPWWDAGRDLDA